MSLRMVTGDNNLSAAAHSKFMPHARISNKAHSGYREQDVELLIGT